MDLLKDVPTKIRSRIIWIFFCGLAFALLFNLPPIVYDLYEYLSYDQTFHEIRLDMSRGEVISILQRDHVGCLISEDDRPADEVEFSDFWRTYAIQFHPVTHRVIRKTFSFREHDSVVKRLLKHQNN